MMAQQHECVQGRWVETFSLRANFGKAMFGRAYLRDVLVLKKWPDKGTRPVSK